MCVCTERRVLVRNWMDSVDQHGTEESEKMHRSDRI